MRKIRALWKLRALLRNPAAAMRVLRDERTPLLAKILPFVALAYLMFPIDIIPDFLLFFGQIDDVAIVVAVISYALSLIPAEVFRAHGLDARI